MPPKTTPKGRQARSESGAAASTGDRPEAFLTPAITPQRNPKTPNQSEIRAKVLELKGKKLEDIERSSAIEVTDTYGDRVVKILGRLADGRFKDALGYAQAVIMLSAYASEGELGKLITKLKAIGNSADSLTNQLSNLQRESDATQRRLEAEKRKLEEANAHLRSEDAYLRRRIAEGAKGLLQKDEKIVALELELVEAKAALERARSRDGGMVTVSKEDWESMQARLKSESKDLILLREQFAALEEKLRAKEEELRLNSIKPPSADKATDVLVLPASKDPSSDDQIARIAQLEAELARKNQEIKSLEADLLVANNSKGQLEAAIALLRSSPVNAAEVEVLKAQIQQKDEELARLRAENSAKNEARIAALEMELADMRLKMEGFESQTLERILHAILQMQEMPHREPAGLGFVGGLNGRDGRDGRDGRHAAVTGGAPDTRSGFSDPSARRGSRRGLGLDASAELFGRGASHTLNPSDEKFKFIEEIFSAAERKFFPEIDYRDHASEVGGVVREKTADEILKVAHGQRRAYFKTMISAINKALHEELTEDMTADNKALNFIDESLREALYEKGVDFEEGVDFIDYLKSNEKFRDNFFEWAESFAKQAEPARQDFKKARPPLSLKGPADAKSLELQNIEAIKKTLAVR